VSFARLTKPPKTESTLVNEYFDDERNAANGTLWTNTNYHDILSLLTKLS